LLQVNSMEYYTVFKLIHISAVILFLGNIITGLFWMKQADKTNNLSIVSFTMKGIISSDRWFTIPGVIIITGAGISAALQNHIPIIRTGWIFWPIILFTFSGIVFSIRLVPLQKKIYELTCNTVQENFNWQLYRKNLLKWERWGLIALIFPLIALILMVLKVPVKPLP